MVSPRWEGRTRERPQHAGGVAHKAGRRAAGTRAAGGKRKRDSTTCVNGLRRKCGREAAAPDPLWWSARRRRRRLGTAAGGSAAVTRAFWVCGGHRGWRKRLQGEGGGHGGPFVSNEVWSRGPSGWRRPARCRAADAEGVALPNGRGHQKHSTTGELPSSELEGGGGSDGRKEWSKGLRSSRCCEPTAVVRGRAPGRGTPSGHVREQKDGGGEVQTDWERVRTGYLVRRPYRHRPMRPGLARRPLRAND